MYTSGGPVLRMIDDGLVLGFDPRVGSLSPSADDRPSTRRARGKVQVAIRRFAPLAVLLMLVALAYASGLHRDVSFESLVRNRSAIDRFIGQNQLAAMASFIALYVAVVGLSLPGGAILTVTGGFLFGSILGATASWLGALGGATIIFLIARSAAGEWLTRCAGSFAANLAAGFRADAFNYLLFLRLVPFPFWLVNLAPALFGVRLSTFIAATAIGMIPATVTFAVFGAGLDSVIDVQAAQYAICMAGGQNNCNVDLGLSNVLTPMLIAAFAAIGALALVPVLARRFFGRKLPAGVPLDKL
jgi:uncharacterized membrane protein YdjX (TVP38/TMEM64 family)